MQFTVVSGVNMPDWRECEGQLLEGRYPLERYVGGDEGSALVLIGSASATVRIRRADAARAAAQSLRDEINRQRRTSANV